MNEERDITVNKTSVSKSENLPESSWQAQVSFPERRGYTDDTLAMNSMYSFVFFEGQGKLYVTVSERVQSFDLFINNVRIDTEEMKSGIFAVDFSAVSENGKNTVQVMNIIPEDLENAVTVKIPFPEVIEGTPEETAISRAALELISRIIEADVRNGFPCAQLAIVKDGRLAYRNSWGLLCSYEQDGTPLRNGIPVNDETMFDLASNTKAFSTVYAVMYLADRGILRLDERIADIIGDEFVTLTEEIRYAEFGNDYPGIEEIRKWKSALTIKDLLMHQAGFADSAHYHNQKYDAVNHCISETADNILFTENAGREKALKAICRTPLMYKPESRTVYSDTGYILLGMIIEKKTGNDLNTFLSETFWKPMGLKRITYCPLENGYGKEDCAATELNGNTRDGLADYPDVRKHTLQGEVHDEDCFHLMQGISGHAGLFASASDLAKLASVMFSGGYGNSRFFSADTRDLFISAQAEGLPVYGIGWFRSGADGRPWYFGTQAPSGTVGHQGWTGTLSMIDFEHNMALIYLTASVNTPIADPQSVPGSDAFAGHFYTSSTLGFVPQILYTGIGKNRTAPDEALKALLKDMIREKRKLVREAAADHGGKLPESHPVLKALKALEEAAEEFCGS